MCENKESNKNRLWAPWRIKYILSEKSGECFLCNREKSGRSDDYMIIARRQNAFVMMNAYPYNSGHLMITPYKHVGELENLKQETLYEIMDLCVHSQNVIKKVMRPDGFNIGFNLGNSAGAGLEEHLHMHIVPRWNGDTNFMPVIGDTRVVPQAIEETAKILRKNF